MYCPFCTNEDTKVLESRLADAALRRRRECLKCSNRFTTYERASFNLTVVKKDGTIQPLDIKKIASSFQRACGKVDEQIIKKLTRQVEQKILLKKTNQIKTSFIGTLVLEELKKHDKMAYLRFASIYKSIDNPKSLKKELSLIA
jgi:transcriptional repressor NrdR